MAFAPIFFPDPLDWAQRNAAPLAPSSWHRQCFAIARLYLPTRRTRQGQASTDAQTSLPVPIRETGHGLRCHFRNVQRTAPSTGTPYARHKRSPRRRVVGLWACDPRPLCDCSSASPRADAAGLMPQHAARMHRSLPMIWPWLLLLQTRCPRMQCNYPLFTDKFLDYPTPKLSHKARLSLEWTRTALSSVN